jgi:hypothetical protein
MLTHGGSVDTEPPRVSVRAGVGGAGPRLARFLYLKNSLLLNYNRMTLEELEREYVSLRQQADAVRSYL